jgi:hypothetical protein
MASNADCRTKVQQVQKFALDGDSGTPIRGQMRRLQCHDFNFGDWAGCSIYW